MKKAKAHGLTQKKILMIIAPEKYRDEEFEHPCEIFKQNGYTITVASKGTDKAYGMLGTSTSVDIDISEVQVENYDAIVFVGGSGAHTYFNDPVAHALVVKAQQLGKVIGAICVAPTTLANAGLLERRKVTSFASEENKLKVHGAQFTGERVTTDQRIVTASGPEAAKDFALAIVSLLKA